MLEEKQDVIYLSINKGSLMRWMGENAPMKSYSKVGGNVIGLYSSVKHIDDSDVMFMYVRMTDGDEVMSVQCPLYSSAGPDIIRSLVYAVRNKMDFVTGGKITIEVFQKRKENNKTFTNARVFFNDTKLDWVNVPNGVSREDGLKAFYNEVVEYIKSKKKYDDDDDLPEGPADAGFPSSGRGMGGYHGTGRSPFDDHR